MIDPNEFSTTPRKRKYRFEYVVIAVAAVVIAAHYLCVMPWLAAHGI